MTVIEDYAKDGRPGVVRYVVFTMRLCTLIRLRTIYNFLLVPWTENHLSSFKCGFMNIFSRQNLLRSLSRPLFLLRWNKYGAKRCLKKHITFDFGDDQV